MIPRQQPSRAMLAGTMNGRPSTPYAVERFGPTRPFTTSTACIDKAPVRNFPDAPRTTGAPPAFQLELTTLAREHQMIPMPARPIRLLLTLAAVALASAGFARAQEITLDKLTEGSTVHGFRVKALFLNDAERPMGARFVHVRTGFVLDLLQIQSVPQGFIWVNSYPTSDMGEPHTQEHLLLGKGNMGRYVANLEGMSLAGSSAYTQQWRTCYHFNTAAGPEVFYEQFQARMDAMLHPDYTDEEIRREVCNFGVAVEPGDGKLRLEEKGTVYNEMVSSFERPWSRLARGLDHAVYGSMHPLAYVSGGLPEAIRRMTPEDIRRFHRDHYRLDNMGMVAACPNQMKPADVLKRTDAILNKLQPGALPPLAVMTQAALPAPKAAPSGATMIAEYPSNNETQPAPLVFAWPAQLKVEPRDYMVLELFIENMASDETSNLYKLFIDSKTRAVDLGAQGVFGWTTTDQGSPIYMGIDDLPQSAMNGAKIAEIRDRIIAEIKRVAAFKDGSPELREFNDRARNRMISNRRALSNLMNSPPGFGFRFASSQWMTHLDQLCRVDGFRKSVTRKADNVALEAMLAGGTNIWRDRIAQWKLTESVPYACGARPSSAVIARETQERKDRIAAEVARLRSKYGVADDQEAIARYRKDYDAGTAEIEKLAAAAKSAHFVSAPPMTLDDQLEYRAGTIGNGVPLVASTFDNMSSATTGIALRLNGVAEQDYIYLSLMPALLTSVGIYENGTAIPSDEMSQRMRREIMSLNASFSSSYRTGRSELVIRGAGNDREEANRAVAWMQRALLHPDWRVENLARIRDVVDQAVGSLRSTMQGSEESWVNNPAAAYRYQDNHLMLATESFLTRAHNAHRLRWLLKDAGPEADRDAIAAFLDRLAIAAAHASRSDLKSLLATMKGSDAASAAPSESMREIQAAFKALPAGARTNATEAAKDLDLILADIPDASLAADWAYLCREIRHDLLVPPAQVLADMNRVRKSLLVTGGVRAFMTGSGATLKELETPLRDLLANFQTSPMMALPPIAQPTRHIESRVVNRTGGTAPAFVGLVNPNTSSGVFLNSASLATYRDVDNESLYQYLASKLFAGHGSHGIFMKTWGAGLAYSNGLGSSAASGRMSYYAERCPELPQTLKFVIDELKKAPRDPSLTEYAIAVAFDENRSSAGYESRGEAMATDLADGITPDLVRNFRKSLLALRSQSNLADSLYDRMGTVYARVLPGYSPTGSDAKDRVYMTVGPEKQMTAYEGYLKAAVSPDAQLIRLYPRDFWLPLQGEVTGN